MTGEEKQKLDDELAGPQRDRRSRSAVLAGLGGDVVSRR
jgi:hypothetical protein